MIGLQGVSGPTRLAFRMFVVLAAAAAASGVVTAAAIQRKALRRTAYPAWCGRVIADLCRFLGPTFVKFAQIASTRPDLLPPEIASALGELRHDVSRKPLPAYECHLPERVKTLRHARRVAIDRWPIASGSIAQVFAMTEKTTGRRFALKVQRPGMSDRFDLDLSLMTRLAPLLQRTRFLGTLPVVEVVASIGDLLRKQLDFRRERDNLEAFSKAYGGWQGVVVPAVADEYCGPRCIAMQRIEDASPDWIRQVPPELASKLAALASRILFDMVFIKGRIHVDMHPGNLVFTPGGKVVLLDAGMSAELTADERRLFVYFFFGLITNSPGMCAYVLLHCAKGKADSFDEQAFRAAVAALIGRYSSLTARDYEVSRFVAELFQVQRRHGLHPSNDFLNAVLSFLVLEGIVKQVAPDFDFQKEAREYILANAIAAGIFQNWSPARRPCKIGEV